MEKIGKTLVLLEPSAPINEGVTPACLCARVRVRGIFRRFGRVILFWCVIILFLKKNRTDAKFYLKIW